MTSQILSTIQITDDFEQIDAEYKRFKYAMFNIWCELSQYALDTEEKNLLQSIDLILQDENNQEDNFIRALIGARVLSKYSIMNQEKCVKFFPQINSQFPQSIQKRLFILKCIAKKCKVKTNYEWDNYIIKIENRILPIRSKRPEKVESIPNALIYIDFLIKYAPGFISKFSNEIISHLIKIVKENKYDFDMTFDILSKTNQTQVQYFSDENAFFANNAIELLRKILLNIKSVRYKSIDINDILSWNQDDKLKILALLSVILESCDKSFLKPKYNSIREYLNFSDDDQKVRCLICRNLILCLEPEETLDDDLTENIIDISSSLENDIIYGKLQNLKLLIIHNHANEIQQKIIDIAFNFIRHNNDEKIRNSAFDLLNSFCLYNDDEEINDLIFNSRNTDQVFETIDFQFVELIKSMLFYNQSLFTLEKFSQSLVKSPLEVLLFLNNNNNMANNANELEEFSLFTDKKEEENDLIKILKEEPKDQLDNKVINPIFELFANEDPQIRSLSPLVLMQICPQEFLNENHLDQLINLLTTDTSNQVRLSVLQSFNCLLNAFDNVNDYQPLKSKLDEIECNDIFMPFLNEYSPRNIQIEAIKFLCLMDKREINKFDFLKSHIDFYKGFVNPNNKIVIVLRKLANSSQYLPYIINSCSTIQDNDIELFLKFAIDFMNITTKDKTNYQNQTHINTNIISKTSFQFKFYEKIYCSYIETLKLFFKTNPTLIESHIGELIDLCITNLYYGMTESETLHTLSLLEQCLYYIGLDKTIEINNRKLFDDETNLYQIVFNTGAHFISPTINKFVFKILGFIGAQLFDENKKTYSTIPKWKRNLDYSLHKISQDQQRRLYFYSSCSELLFDVLEDESMSNSHFIALKSLIKILNRADMQPERLTKEFKRSFSFFKKLLNNSSAKGKNEFVPLLEKLINFDFQVIKDSIPDLVQCLIDLWSFGSSSILIKFAQILKLNLSPYLNEIIPLIMIITDQSKLVELLVSIYTNVVFNVNDKKVFFLDIINILINMINEEKYEALKGLNKLIPILVDLEQYIPTIVLTCTNIITAFNENKNNNDDTDILNQKCFDDTIEVLNTLILNSKNSLSISQIFDDFLESIMEAISSFPDELEKLSKSVDQMKDKDIKNDIVYPESNKKDEKKESDYIQFNNDKFINVVTWIKDFIDNGVNSLYLHQWLYELEIFCIQESPSFTIRSTFPVVKNNPSLALSIFNIAFYSCVNHRPTRPQSKAPPKPKKPESPKNSSDSKNSNDSKVDCKKKTHIRINGDPRTKLNPPEKTKNNNKFDIVESPSAPPKKEGNPPEMPNKPPPKKQTVDSPLKIRMNKITDTFIALFKMERMPSKIRTILINLITFMDRANMPIFNIGDLESIHRPITSIFAGDPSLSLQFSLRYYYQKKSLTDLGRAFLNAGLVDQYQHFVRLNNIDNNNSDNTVLPIYASTIESIHHLSIANDFFLLKDWNNFKEQLDLSDDKVISHLFKTAYLIQKYWSSNPNEQTNSDISNDFIFNYINHKDDENYEDKLQVLKEIEMGFDALGYEIGTSFSQGNASALQSIIYGQQFTELQEMFFSNGQRNNFTLRFLNADQISSFLHHILLLRIAAKGENKNSLIEKVSLFSLCRKSSKWNLMNKYSNYFFKSENEAPLEILYEMMYCKLANDEAKEDDFDQLLQSVSEMINQNKTNDYGPEYEYSTLEKFIKYQKAVYYAHSFNESNKFKQVIELCNDFDNADAINLWSWANLKLFKKGGRQSLHLIEAIKGYIRGSLKSDKMRVSNMISIISLLFTHFPHFYSVNEIRSDFEKVPLYYFIDCAPQIISYIHRLNEKDKEFNEFIFDLLINLMKKHPHGVIYEYNFSLLCDDRKNKDEIIKSPIDKVRNYFLQNRDALDQVNARNIFYQAYELTNNLYKVSSDIKGITLNFVRYAFPFMEEENISSHSETEIGQFIGDLEYMNKEYFIPLHNYIAQNGKDYYKPNTTEANDISDLSLQSIFNLLFRYVQETIINYRSLLKWRKQQRKAIDLKNKYKISYDQRTLCNMQEKSQKKLVPRKKLRDLSASERPKPIKRNLTKTNEEEEDYYDDEYDEENNKPKHKNIENEPLYSLPVSKKTSSIPLKLDDEKISYTKTDTLHPKFDGKYPLPPPPKPKTEEEKLLNKIEKLGKDIKRYENSINRNLKEIDNFQDIFRLYYSKLKNAVDREPLQHDIFTESPKMESMVNLCLPVFGTYRYNEEPILIQRFDRKCESKISIARPKQIKIIGNNGSDYSFILKASEDLRTDQRFMIFFRFLNRFLNTKIRTYSVTPLTVRFGIIQFVENTTSLDALINANRTKMKFLKEAEKNFLKANLNEEVFKKENQYDRLTSIQKYEKFGDLIDNFPKRSFDLRDNMWICAPNSETWITYTVNYSKYCAVTSIVGYIIGIGDRHTNNILFDKTNGTLVHIDFTDCFEVNQKKIRSREKVPFRLTRNMICAFGPCGCNGTFRTNCEDTLSLIRENREIIYNILEVFSVSPVQVHGRVKQLQRTNSEINRTQKKNKFIMERIESKLNGTDESIVYDESYTTKVQTPISVNEQVDKLIARASDGYYVSSSYSGWRPWI